ASAAARAVGSEVRAATAETGGAARLYAGAAPDGTGPALSEIAAGGPVPGHETLKNSMAPSMQMKPEQKANIENRIMTQVTKTPAYKDWSFANEALGKIENVVNNLKDGSISNAVAADQFTQIFNG